MEMEGKRGQQNGGVDFRRWEGLNPAILALIFVKILPVEEMVRSVSLVCKGWMEALAEPDCWTEINVEEWCRRRWSREISDKSCCSTIDYVVRKLVRRSKFTFRKLAAYRLGDAGFSYVANCGRFLKVLDIRVSGITDQIVEKHAESLASLKELDISYCLMITSKGLEAFGKHCKLLTHLKRNMPPLYPMGPSFPVDIVKTDDREALVIAQTMPGLHHLELAFCPMSEHGLTAILAECSDLSYLDIQGCLQLKLEGDLERRCKRFRNFKGTFVDGDDDNETSSEASRDNDSSSEESTDNNMDDGLCSFDSS